MTTVTASLLAQGLLQDPGRVPLVIGVTGHRDPRPEVVPVVRESTRQQLRQLMAALPHTPLVMLNGMAAGIDSEIAEAFLAVVAQQRSQSPAGCQALPQHQLVAALPKTPEQFAEDFSDDTSLQRMQALLKCSDAVTARKDDAPAADHAAITNVVGLVLFSGSGGLIQTTSG